MHRNLAKAALMLGALVASATVASVTIVGCSGDDTSNAPGDGGNLDATLDGRADAPTADGPTGEAGGEGGPSTDAGDAADVQYDVPPVNGYTLAVSEAFCARLRGCCLVPAQQWNQDGDGGCVQTLEQGGGVANISTYNAALDGGHVVYDKAAAAKCFQEVAAINCGLISAAQQAKIVDDCYAALRGTLAIDAGPCVNSLECTSGAYCRIPGDASTGRCVAVQAVGQPCSDVLNSTDCTYLGNGTPAAYCDPGDGAAPPRCASAKPLDAGCNFSQECQSRACNSPVCVNSVVFSDPGVPNGTCAFFTIQDGGTD